MYLLPSTFKVDFINFILKPSIWWWITKPVWSTPSSSILVSTPASRASVGTQSVIWNSSEVVDPGAIPGPLTKAGTLTPPSQIVHFEPLSGQLVPPRLLLFIGPCMAPVFGLNCLDAIIFKFAEVGWEWLFSSGNLALKCLIMEWDKSRIIQDPCARLQKSRKLGSVETF